MLENRLEHQVTDIITKGLDETFRGKAFVVQGYKVVNGDGYDVAYEFILKRDSDDLHFSISVAIGREVKYLFGVDDYWRYAPTVVVLVPDNVLHGLYTEIGSKRKLTDLVNSLSKLPKELKELAPKSFEVKAFAISEYNELISLGKAEEQRLLNEESTQIFRAAQRAKSLEDGTGVYADKASKTISDGIARDIEGGDTGIDVSVEDRRLYDRVVDSQLDAITKGFINGLNRMAGVDVSIDKDWTFENGKHELVLELQSLKGGVVSLDIYAVDSTAVFTCLVTGSTMDFHLDARKLGNITRSLARKLFTQNGLNSEVVIKVVEQ